MKSLAYISTDAASGFFTNKDLDNERLYSEVFKKLKDFFNRSSKKRQLKHDFYRIKLGLLEIDSSKAIAKLSEEI